MNAPVQPTGGVQPAGGVSDAAVSLILNAEVSSPAYYAAALTHPTWPGGDSGVTIGVGYDLGYVSRSGFQSDWGALLPAATLGRLATCCGVTGAAAQKLVAGLHDIDVPWAAAESVFRSETIPTYATRTYGALPNTGALSPDSFGALVSLVYNRGASFTAAGDRYTEMRAIKAAMAASQFDAVPAQLRAMKRLWQGVPGMSGLVSRREAEAVLFEQGLGGPAPQSADDLNAVELARHV